jgi:hypothetical protein
MTELPPTDSPTDLPRAGRQRRRHIGRRIKMPNGDTAWPRLELAEEELGMSEKALKRRRPPTTYIGGVAYCPHDETIKRVITDRIRRADEPRRRGR